MVNNIPTNSETTGFIIQNAVRLPSGKLIYSRHSQDQIQEEGIQISGGHSALNSNLVPLKYFKDYLLENPAGTDICLFPEDDFRITTSTSIDFAATKVLVEFYDNAGGKKRYYYKPAIECSVEQIDRYLAYLHKQRGTTTHKWFVQVLNAKIMLLDFVAAQKHYGQTLFA